MKFTIRMNDKVMLYSKESTPVKQFEQAMKHMDDIQGMRKRASETAANVIAQSIEEDMILVIFGSNHIERAGKGLDETQKICEAIFRGEHVEERPRSEEYEKRLREWINSKRDPKEFEADMIRSRNEVIQHAKALQLITQKVVTDGEPITEKLLKETHKILIQGVNHAKYGTAWQDYAGKYRGDVRDPESNAMGVEVHARGTNFTPVKRVPDAMKGLIKEFNKDMEQAEKDGALDPYTLAAKYSARFVCIHPFFDGNGRVCRLLLNAILLKYAGIVVSIGEHDEERKDYLDIKRRYSRDMEGEGEFAAMVLNRATLRLKNISDKVRAALNL